MSDYTLEDVMTALRNADARAEAGDVGAKGEAARLARIASQMAKKAGGDGSFVSDGGEGGAMGRVNKGIAETLGAPVDKVNSLLGRVGLESEKPFGGSDSIKDAMRVIGADTPTNPPMTPAETILEGAGEGAGALLPFMGAAKGLSKGNGLTSRVADSMVAPFQRAPIRSTGSEMAAAAGANYGGNIAEELGHDPMVGEILGSLAPTVAPSVALKTTGWVATKTPVLGTFIRGAKATLTPFTRSGGGARASARVRDLSSDPEGQAARLDPKSPLSPAQQTGDERLMALERSILDTDAAMSEEFKVKTARASDALRAALKEPAGDETIADAREFIEGRRTYFLSLLDQRIAQAKEIAESKLQSMQPKRSDGANSSIVMGEIDKAYADARKQETELWELIPRGLRVPTSQSQGALADLFATTGLARRGDIPSIAIKLIGEDGQLGRFTNAGEMLDLYSKMRETQRHAISGSHKRLKLYRNAGAIADAILDDLGAGALPSSDLGMLINDARAFSRELNERFEQDTVGRLRGKTLDGGDRVADELALGSTIGKGGTGAKVALDDIQNAVGAENLNSQEAIQDYLKGQFLRYAAPRGEFNPGRADDFLRDNTEILDRMPQFKQQLRNQIDLQVGSKKIVESTEARSGALQNPKQSYGAALERTQVGKEVDAIFKAQNPAKAAAALARQARKDTSGAASRGLKGGVLDYLMGKSRTSNIDEDGEYILSGRRLIASLSDAKTQSAMRQIFTPAELKRVRQVAEELRKLEAASGRLPSVGQPMNDRPAAIISFVARTAAARQGAKAGQGTSGASLLTANFASRRIQTILENLTNDRAEDLLKEAMTDVDLFKALLLNDTATPATVKRAEAALSAWAVGAGAALAAED